MERQNTPSAFARMIKNVKAEYIVNLVLVPILLFGSLWLPPASVGARLFNSSYSVITADEGLSLQTVDGATVSIPAGAVEKRTRLRLELLGFDEQVANAQVSANQFVSSAAAGNLLQIADDAPEAAALDSIPADVIVYGPLYRFDLKSDISPQAEITLPLPYELAAVHTADIYVWDGSQWQWQPSTTSQDGLHITSSLEAVPRMVMIGQRQAFEPSIVLGTAPEVIDDLPTALSSAVVVSDPLTVEDDDYLCDSVPSSEELRSVTEGPLWLRVTNNVDGIFRSDLTDNLVIDEAASQSQIEAILAQAAQGGYSGVRLNYAGTHPDLRIELTAYLSNLADALHSTGKILAVVLPKPIRTDDGWDTGAYDWAAIGQLADYISVPALSSPEAYVQDGLMDAYLTWATDQIDRHKIHLAFPAAAVEIAGQETQRIAYADALSLMARELEMSDADGLLLPGEELALTLGDLAHANLAFDADAQVYILELGDVEQHLLQLETGSSTARKLQYVNQYALGGLAIGDGLDASADPDILTVLANYAETQADALYASNLESRFSYVWTVEDDSGYVVDRQIQPLTDPDWEWTAPNNPGNYVIKAAVSDDSGSSELGAVSEVGVEVPTPTYTPTPTPTNTPTPTPVPTDTPVPTATPKPEPKPVAITPGGYFGYGIQAAMVSDGDHGRIMDHVQAMGLGWVKQQVEWFRYNPAPGQYDWGALDRIVESANARGINVLFSVVKAPSWARPPGDTDQGPPADPNTYATFVREMAARYKGRVKAYEIWNEQNLYYEWGGRGGKLNAGKYVELLAAAYTAIKSVDPGAVVISGALTPTGVNDGDIAIDDRVYLEQMYQAGLARYCDAVGAHPSGYNNPPDADWQTWSDPTTPHCKSHPSWFFRGTMESYRNIMVKYGDGHKRVWPTEFGWASVEGLGVGPAPGYGYAGENTEAEQAQFITRAFQMGKAWGWVGPMFLWNLNFAPVAGKSDEKAAFGVVRHDWSPRPAFAAIRDMPK